MGDDHPAFLCEPTRFLSRGEEIVGQLFLPNTKERVSALLISHGLFGFKETYREFGEFLAKRGIAVLTMDMHGHGRSGGERFAFHLLDWVADIRAAVDFLVAHPQIDPNRIAGFGLYSGGTAILEAALVEPRLKALITVSASVQNNCTFWETFGLETLRWIGIVCQKFKHRSFRASVLWALPRVTCMADAEINAQWHAFPLVKEAFASIPFPATTEALVDNTIRHVKRIRTPTLVLHGMEDCIEPPQSAQLLYNALTCEKALHFIPKNGHLGHLDQRRQRVFELTAEWIWDKLPSLRRTIAVSSSVGSLKVESLHRYLEMYGRGCLAYSTLQMGMQYFVEKDVGYIAYYKFEHPLLAPRGKRLVLADPVTSREKYAFILERFLEDPTPAIFLQVSQEFAVVLSQYIPEINQGGIETEVDLFEFDLHGKTRGQLRHWINKAIKEEVEVFEESVSGINPNEVHGLSEDWLERKGGREFIIMTRPFTFSYEKDVRYFWARREGKLIGMVVFDPMYENGKIIGYYQNFVRATKEAPHGTIDLITFQAMEHFKSEGVRVLSLGISPFCDIHDTDFNYNKTLAWAMKESYRYGHRIYNFEGGAFHKKKYGGTEKKIYFGGTQGNSVKEMFSVMNAVRMI